MSCPGFSWEILSRGKAILYSKKNQKLRILTIFMLLQKGYYPNVSQKAKGEENEVIIFRTIRSCRRHITTAKGSLLASRTELFF